MSGTDFYGSKNPTDSVKALKEDWVLRIKLQSNQVHTAAHLSVLMTVQNFSTQYNTAHFW